MEGASGFGGGLEGASGFGGGLEGVGGFGGASGLDGAFGGGFVFDGFGPEEEPCADETSSTRYNALISVIFVHIKLIERKLTIAPLLGAVACTWLLGDLEEKWYRYHSSTWDVARQTDPLHCLMIAKRTPANNPRTQAPPITPPMMVPVSLEL